MDEEVRKLAEKAFQRTVELMEKYRDDVQRVADLLIKQETISHSDVANLIGDRKFSAGKEYDEFVATKKKINAEAAEAAEAEVVVEAQEGDSSKPNSAGEAQVGLA
jgi:AFG3 family protein